MHPGPRVCWSMWCVCECLSEQVPHIGMKPDESDVYCDVDVGEFGMTPGGNSYVDGVVENL